MSVNYSKECSFKALSRDEMNLVEFPISVLSKRTDPNTKTLEFTDYVTSKAGDQIERKWIITGADKFGLPTSSDDEVLLGLLKLSVDKGFAGRKIFFTRYELLRILKWSTEGRSYSRLQKALDRLSGVRIKTTNGFFDNDTKRHTTKNFGLIDEYEINSQAGGDLPSSFFVWSDIMFRSFQVGFIKRLDLNFYLDLKTAVAKRLFRYLDKHFWYKSQIRKNLFVFCHEKIGVSRNFRYASSLLQQIEPGVEELIERGFLQKFETFGRGRHLEVVFYSNSVNKPDVITEESAGYSKFESSIDTNVAHSSRNKEPESLSPDIKLDKLLPDSLASSTDFIAVLGADLIARGLRPSQVPKLLSGRSRAELQKVRLVIGYFDALCAGKSKLVSKSPVGFLYRAIESLDNFVIPEQFRNCLEKQPNQVNSVSSRRVTAVSKKSSNVDLSSLTPDELSEVKAKVERTLAKMKGIVSEKRYNEAVLHGIEMYISGRD
jgi:hypothetical protein